MPAVNEKAVFATQLTYDTSTGTGSYANFSGTLAHLAAIIIFDNQSNVAVTVSDNGTVDGKTFAANSALTLDLRANASNPQLPAFSWPVGTQFKAKCSAGTGTFYITVIYAS